MGNSPSSSAASSPLFGSPLFVGLEKRAKELQQDLMSIFDSPEARPADLGPAAAQMTKSKDTKSKDSTAFCIARNKAELRSASEKSFRNMERSTSTMRRHRSVPHSVPTEKPSIAAEQRTRKVSTEPRVEPRKPQRRVVGDGCPAAAGRLPGSHSPVREAQLRAVAIFVRSLQKSVPGAFVSQNVFDCAREPRVSLTGFLAYLVDGVNASPECIALAAVLLDRFVAKSGTAVHSRNVHRLLLAAFVLAHKYLNDLYHTNSAYAQVGQVPLRQLNQMEVFMLNGLNWELEASEEELSAVLRV